jgi:integrase
MAENPIRGQLHLPEQQSRGEEAVWTKETYEQVLKHANENFANVVRMLAWTGCRPSTLCRVEARHYNGRHRRWDVEDLYRGRNKRKHVKHIRLPRQAASLVEKLNAKYPTGPIFRNSKGEPYTATSLQIYLYNMQTKFKATKRLEWQSGLCIYGLRHTFATHYLAEHPNEMEYLRVLLGHKDYKMILQHYGHLVEQHEQIQKRMDGFSPFGD